MNWYTFNGNLAATKFSPADAITPSNVRTPQRVWECHTGDVSDGSGKHPKTVWSATPLYVNNTVYLGTPFYRILALQPDTGRLRWSYDTHAKLEATTQPSLKNRGVACWESSEPRATGIAAKRVFIGTMDAKVHAVDADTGVSCVDFGENGVVWASISVDAERGILYVPVSSPSPNFY